MARENPTYTPQRPCTQCEDTGAFAPGAELTGRLCRRTCNSLAGIGRGLPARLRVVFFPAARRYRRHHCEPPTAWLTLSNAVLGRLQYASKDGQQLQWRLIRAAYAPLRDPAHTAHRPPSLSSSALACWSRRFADCSQ